MEHSNPQSTDVPTALFSRRRAMAGAGLGITAMALPRAAVAASNGDFTGSGFPADTNMTMSLRFNISGTRKIKLELYRTSYVTGAITATVNWGDGTSSTLNGSSATFNLYPTKTYASNGVYDVSITATAGMGYGSGGGGSYSGEGQSMLTDVLSWNNIGGLVGAFQECTNLVSVPNMLPTGVNSLSYAFSNCTSFNSPLNNWNTAWVTNMEYAFNATTAFNQNIGSWNTGAVTTMERMFNQATAFNNGGTDTIKNWNTANVTTMSYMFSSTSAFNQPIGSWNTSKVSIMAAMFYFSSAFNQDIGAWNTGAVTNMSSMFNTATAFNNGGSNAIGNWNTGAVTNMSQMFLKAVAFNQPIASWNTGAVTNMSQMFYNSTAPNMAFDQDVSGWNVTNVTNYANFIKATAPQYISAGWTSSERPSKFGL